MTSLPPAIVSVLELFKGPLSSVRFADIDAAGLASLAAEVEAAGSEVQRHEESLAELRQALAQRQDALLVLAQRALAYARVYAENDEPLLEELNRIALPRVPKPRKAAAAKTSGMSDAARSEPTAEAAAAAAAQAPVGNVDADVDADADADAAGGSVEAAPLRPGRKARGAAAQRAAN